MVLCMLFFASILSFWPRFRESVTFLLVINNKTSRPLGPHFESSPQTAADEMPHCCVLAVWEQLPRHLLDASQRLTYLRAHRERADCHRRLLFSGTTKPLQLFLVK